MKHAHWPFLPQPDADTQRALNNIHHVWRRQKYGAAALGCALLLGACGGNDEAAPDQDGPPPIKAPTCPERRTCL